MKNLLLILITFISFQSFAQLNLKFDKRYAECEDQWIAYPMRTDSSYNYGFIYIDSQAGFTYNNEGTFKVKKDGTLEIKKIKDANVKVRLEPNKVKVAFIPSELFKALEIEETPDWLSHYKTDLNTAARNYRWGYTYNAWNECQQAIPFLLKSREMDPNFAGLSVELAFSYNCLKEYDKAVTILEEELKTNPNDAYVVKEYIYSTTKTKDIEKAEFQYNQSLKTITDNPYKAENCFNILQYHYNQTDKKNFSKWYKELQKSKDRHPTIDKYAEIFKKDINEK